MTATEPVHAETIAVARAELTSAQRAEMFALLARHFEGVTREQFERDLAEKNWALLVRCDGRLAGFTTLHAYQTMFEARSVNVIYSGDTIMEPEAWGTTALARGWIALVNRLRAAMPPGPCHWLLLTSGFRTYRFLPVFWREFWPRHEAPTPAAARGLLTHLARERFDAGFDEAAGVVRLPLPQRLRDPLRDVSAGRTADPHIAFFLARNPGHAGGDELVCLTELGPENLTPAGERMARASTP